MDKAQQLNLLLAEQSVLALTVRSKLAGSVHICMWHLHRSLVCVVLDIAICLSTDVHGSMQDGQALPTGMSVAVCHQKHPVHKAVVGLGFRKCACSQKAFT